jgi:hypothetical protein
MDFFETNSGDRTLEFVAKNDHRFKHHFPSKKEKIPKNKLKAGLIP